jgi:MFS family permease
MSGESASAGKVESGHLGVIATWRQTPGPARALLAGVFVNRIAGFLTIFLILFLKRRGFSTGEAGIALGLYGAGAVVGTFVGGYLSDRISARAATIISMGGSALLLISIIYIKIYALILVAAVLLGLVSAIYRPAAQTIITDLVPPSQLVMVTAMYRLCLNLGTTVAPLIGVALFNVSYTLLFWVEAAAALIYLVIALRYLPRKPRPAAVGATATTPQEKAPKGSYLDVLRDVRYDFFLLSFLVLCLVYVQYTAILPLAITAAHLSLWWYGAVITLNAAIVVTCEVVATKWVQTWPKRLTVLTGFALLALGYAVYGIKMIPVFLILGTLIWTISEITGTPTVYAYPGLVAPAHLRGRYFGAMQSMYGLGSTLGPIFGVLLFERVGQAAFWWAALVAVLATGLSQIGVRNIDTSVPEPMAGQTAGQAAPAPAGAEPAGA